MAICLTLTPLPLAAWEPQAIGPIHQKLGSAWRIPRGGAANFRGQFANLR